MKKIIIALMSIFVAVAIIFFIRDKSVSADSFLEFISTLRFTNAHDSLQRLINLLGRTLDAFNSIPNSSNIGEFLLRIITAIYGFIFGIVYLIICLMDVFKDVFFNINSIFQFLF